MEEPKHIKTKCVSLNDLGHEMHTDAEKKLTEIFEYASGLYLEAGTYSDRKIAKGVQYAMEDLVERFFKKESEQEKSRLIAWEINKKFNIDEAVLEHLKNLTK